MDRVDRSDSSSFSPVASAVMLQRESTRQRVTVPLAMTHRIVRASIYIHVESVLIDASVTSTAGNHQGYIHSKSLPWQRAKQSKECIAGYDNTPIHDSDDLHVDESLPQYIQYCFFFVFFLIFFLVINTEDIQIPSIQACDDVKTRLLLTEE